MKASVAGFFILVIAGICSAWPGVAVAQTSKAPPATVEAYGAVFDDWAKRRQPKSAVLVIRRNGKTVFAKGQNADPFQPSLIASLSKPITGACIGTLIRDGKLSFTTPLRDALARFFRLYGLPFDERLLQVTIEELLVHRSGLRGNGDDDPIYGILARRADNAAGSLPGAEYVLGEYVRTERLARHPGGRYSYSNTGYEVLTAIIEEQTGRLYEDYCGEVVFGKLGIAVPKLHPDWRMLAGAGGWFVPGPDYLAFLDVFDPAHPFLGDAVKAWIDQAQTHWTPTNLRGRWYSLGINTWAGTGRWTVSHGGLIRARGKNLQGQATDGFVISHAFRAADGTAVFIAIEWTQDAEDALNDLREKIGRTHRFVKSMP